MTVDVNPNLVRELMRAEDEKELFEALDIGIKTAAAAARAIAFHRTEGRWSQIALLIAGIGDKASMLRHGKRLAPLQLPDNAKPIKDFMQ